MEQGTGRSTMSRAGLVVTATGAAAQAAGIALDAVQHIRDPGLASTEALLSITNVPHLLLFSGMAAVMIGITTLLAAPRLAGRSVRLQLALPLAMALLVVVGTGAAARAGLAEPHGHDDTPVAVLPASQVTPEAELPLYTAPLSPVAAVTDLTPAAPAAPAAPAGAGHDATPHGHP